MHIHTYMHTYIHLYVYPYMYTYRYICISTFFMYQLPLFLEFLVCKFPPDPLHLGHLQSPTSVSSRRFTVLWPSKRISFGHSGALEDLGNKFYGIEAACVVRVHGNVAVLKFVCRRSLQCNRSLPRNRIQPARTLAVGLRGQDVDPCPRKHAKKV